MDNNVNITVLINDFEYGLQKWVCHNQIIRTSTQSKQELDDEVSEFVGVMFREQPADAISYKYEIVKP